MFSVFFRCHQNSSVKYVNCILQLLYWHNNWNDNLYTKITRTLCRNKCINWCHSMPKCKLVLFLAPLCFSRQKTNQATVAASSQGEKRARFWSRSWLSQTGALKRSSSMPNPHSNSSLWDATTSYRTKRKRCKLWKYTFNFPAFWIFQPV